MKNKFYMHGILFKFGVIGSICITAIITIIGVVLTYLNNSFSSLFFGSILFALMIIYLVFLKKETLCKIEFTKEKIIVTRLKKVLLQIDWSDVIEVKETSHSAYTYYLTFVTKKGNINMDLTQKIYDALVSTCPYLYIINKINSLEHFKWFSKKYNKKI